MHRILSVAIALILAAVPAVAQQKSSSDAQAMERARAFVEQIKTDWNKKDAKALAAHFTSNGLIIGPDGKMVSGRAAIEAYYNTLIGSMGNFTFDAQPAEAHAIGSGLWTAGASSFTITGPNGTTVRHTHVTQILVPQGKAWKIRMLHVSADVAPPNATR